MKRLSLEVVAGFAALVLIVIAIGVPSSLLDQSSQPGSATIASVPSELCSLLHDTQLQLGGEISQSASFAQFPLLVARLGNEFAKTTLVTDYCNSANLSLNDDSQSCLFWILRECRASLPSVNIGFANSVWNDSLRKGQVRIGSGIGTVVDRGSRVSIYTVRAAINERPLPEEIEISYRDAQKSSFRGRGKILQPAGSSNSSIVEIQISEEVQESLSAAGITGLLPCSPPSYESPLWPVMSLNNSGESELFEAFEDYSLALSFSFIQWGAVPIDSKIGLQGPPGSGIFSFDAAHNDWLVCGISLGVSPDGGEQNLGLPFFPIVEEPIGVVEPIEPECTEEESCSCDLSDELKAEGHCMADSDCSGGDFFCHIEASESHCQTGICTCSLASEHYGCETCENGCHPCDGLIAPPGFILVEAYEDQGSSQSTCPVQTFGCARCELRLLPRKIPISKIPDRIVAPIPQPSLVPKPGITSIPIGEIIIERPIISPGSTEPPSIVVPISTIVPEPTSQPPVPIPSSIPPQATPTPTPRPPLVIGERGLSFPFGPDGPEEAISLERPITSKSNPVSPEVSGPDLRDSVTYFERREEFEDRFYHWRIIYEDGSDRLLPLTRERAIERCRSLAQADPNRELSGKYYRTRLLSSEEYNYFGLYLADKLTELPADGELRFWSSDPIRYEISNTIPGGVTTFPVISVFKPNANRFDFHLGIVSPQWKQPANLAFAFCVIPKLPEGVNTSELFEKTVAWIPKNPDVIELTAEKQELFEKEWQIYVNRKRLAEFSGLPFELPEADFPHGIQVKAYMKFFFKVFGSIEPLLNVTPMPAYHDGASFHLAEPKKHCSVFSDITSNTNFNVHIYDVFAAYFGSWFVTRCNNQISNQQLFEPSLQSLMYPSLEENMAKREAIASAASHKCTDELYQPDFLGGVSKTYCNYGGVLDFIPLVSTSNSYALAIDECIATQCGGKSVELFAEAGVNTALDFTGTKYVKGGAKQLKTLLKSASIAARSVQSVNSKETLKAIFRSTEHFFQKLTSHARTMRESVAQNSLGLFRNSFYTAEERLGMSLQTWLGGPVVDAFEAETILMQRGIEAKAYSVLYKGVEIPVVEIVNVAENASSVELRRLRKLVLAMKRTNQPGQKAYRIILDTTDAMSKLGINGAYFSDTRYLLVRPTHISLLGAATNTLFHELIHLLDFDRLARGRLSQYLASVTGRLGHRIEGAYASNVNLSELKAFLASIKSDRADLRSLLRQRPDWEAKIYADIADTQDEELKVLRSLWLELSHDLRQYGGISRDLGDTSFTLSRNFDSVKVKFAKSQSFGSDFEYTEFDGVVAIIEEQSVGNRAIPKMIIPLDFERNVQRDVIQYGVAAEREAHLRKLLKSRLDKWYSESEKAWNTGKETNSHLGAFLSDGITFGQSDEYRKMSLKDLVARLDLLIKNLDEAVTRDHIIDHTRAVPANSAP